jgi:hypothetical protein
MHDTRSPDWWINSDGTTDAINQCSTTTATEIPSVIAPKSAGNIKSGRPGSIQKEKQGYRQGRNGKIDPGASQRAMFHVKPRGNR